MKAKLPTPKECVDWLMSSGMSTTDVAKAVGCTRGTIENIQVGGDTSYQKADRLRELFADRKENLRRLLEATKEAEHGRK